MNPVQEQLSLIVQIITETSEPWMPKPTPPPEKPWDGSVSDLLEKGRKFLSELGHKSFWQPRGLWSPDRKSLELADKSLICSISMLTYIAITEINNPAIQAKAVEALVQKGLRVPFDQALLKASCGLLAIAKQYPQRFAPWVITDLKQWHAVFDARNKSTGGLVARHYIHKVIELVEVYQRNAEKFGRGAGASIPAVIVAERKPVTVAPEIRGKTRNTELMIRFWLAQINGGYASPENLARYAKTAVELSRKPGIHLELIRQVNHTYFAVHRQMPQRAARRYAQTRMSGVRALERVSRF